MRGTEYIGDRFKSLHLKKLAIWVVSLNWQELYVENRYP